MDPLRTLRKALNELRQERERLDRKIQAVEGVLNSDERSGRRRQPLRDRGRRAVSRAARAAASRRMKAYWAKRKKGTKKKE